MKFSALCLTLAAGCLCNALLAPAQDAPAPSPTVKQEPYVWDSVTIKANGFINGIVFSPVQKDLVYINTDMGGAYRYDAAAQKWVCLTDWIQYNDGSLANGGVETLATDPTDANRVYAGVGTYMGKSAIIRSTDQGRTWQRTDVPFGMNGNGSARNSGQRMMVDPNLPGTLYYGTRTKGLWKSTDYGATWNAVESFPSVGDTQGPTRDTGITWVLFDKNSGSAGTATKTIYVGVMTLNGPTIFRSTDAGASWQPVPHQPGEKLLPTRAAMTPDGKTIYMTYVVANDYPGPFGVVGGAVYKLVNPASDAPQWTDVSPSRGRFGWSGISIDPKNPEVLLTSVLNRYNPADDIYRSTDGGKTWTGLNLDKNRDDSSAPYAKYMGTHWVGDVQIDPLEPNVAMYTTGYGLYRTTNATAPEPKWVFWNEGFEQTAVLELVSPPSGTAYLLSAIGDRDGYRHDDFKISPVHGHFGGAQKRTMGNTQDLEIAWNDPSIVVRSGARAQYSFDGGITWDWFKDPPAAAANAPTTAPATQRARGRRIGANVALAADGQRVLVSAAGGSFYADRNGQAWGEWQPIANGPGAGANLMSDPANAKRFYARNGNAFWTSTDGGLTWAHTGDLTAPAGWVRVAIGHEGHLWASARNEGIFRSTDAGKTWTRVNADAVKVANQVGVGAAAPGKDYPAIFIGGTVGNLNGFFRSDDQGQTWVRINDDQHHYGWVTVIQGDSRVFGRLYVGANGRGILYGERKQ